MRTKTNSRCVLSAFSRTRLRQRVTAPRVTATKDVTTPLPSQFTDQNSMPLPLVSGVAEWMSGFFAAETADCGREATERRQEAWKSASRGRGSNSDFSSSTASLRQGPYRPGIARPDANKLALIPGLVKRKCEKFSRKVLGPLSRRDRGVPSGLLRNRTAPLAPREPDRDRDKKPARVPPKPPRPLPSVPHL